MRDHLPSRRSEKGGADPAVVRAGAPAGDMVSHRFSVEDAPQAMGTAVDAELSAKVLIAAG